MSLQQTKSRTNGRRRGSGAGGLITAGVLAGVVSVPALAGPSGEQVVHGSARFDRSGNTTTITTSNRAIINYDSFNLSQQESVRFIQPGSGSKVLNRIQSNTPTNINGSIFANGNVYFVNRAGIYFGQNAVINVGGIYAAAGNITNQDFLNNVNRFTDLQGEVINRGVINASKEAHLVGRRVANFGSIVAPNGMITMAAGDDVLLGQRGGKVFARISGDSSNAGAVGVENHGVIDAGSGQVLAGVGDHFALALYDTSVIRGDSVRIAGGAQSTVRVRGEIDASNEAGRGGQIDVLGGKIGVYGADLNASGTTAGGEIHIGGDYQGVGDRLRAEVTLVDSGTTLNVDSTQSGKAGRSIVWSDGATVFHGDISGKGVREGGFAEVSSKGYLDFRGTFDLSGAVKNGSLLLDPKNIIISAVDMGGAMSIGDVDDFAVNASATSIIHDDLLSSWLNGGVVGDVILKANNDILFYPFSSVVQNAGQSSSLQLFAGRRVVFAPSSTLIMGGGSLLAVGNAVDEIGFVAAERDAGFGTVIFAQRSNVQILGAGQSADIRVDASTNNGGRPGAVIMLGELISPNISITALDAASQVLIGEDGLGATTQFGLNSNLLIDAGGQVAFLNNAGVWSFGSLDVTAGNGISFDGAATGVTATAGDLRFAGSGLATDAAGQFTFSGLTSLETAYEAQGSVAFQDAVTIAGGDQSITLANGGLLDFQQTLASEAGEGRSLTLDLGTGSVRFQGAVGDAGAARLGDLDISSDGGQVEFQADAFASAFAIGTNGATPADVLFAGSTLDATSAIGIRFSNSIQLGTLNAPLVELIADGVDLTIDLASALGNGIDDLRLTSTTGDIVLASSGDVDFSASGLDIADFRLSAGDEIFFNGAQNWTLQNLNASAVGDISLDANAQQFDWANALSRLDNLAVPNSFALDSSGGIIRVLGSSLSFGGGAEEFALRNDVVADTDLTFSRSVRLFGGNRSITLLNPGSLTFDQALAADAATGLTLELAGGGAAFMSTVGAGAGNALGDIDVNGLAGVLSFGGDVAAGALAVGDQVGDDAGSVSFAGASRFAGAAGVDINAATTSVTGGLFADGGALRISDALNLGGTLESFAGITVGGDTVLTNDSIVTLDGAGDLLFAGAISGTTNSGEDLVVNLNGNGNATFDGAIGSLALSIGDLAINGLSDTLTFNNFVFADSLTSASGSGTINLGDGDDLFLLRGVSAAGFAVNLRADMVNLQGNMLANTRRIRIDGPLTVVGDRSIGSLGLNGVIDLGSVVLDASSGLANLTLNSFAGADVLVANAAGESVTRDASGLNSAELNINSFGGDVTLGRVVANGAADNYLSLLDVQAGAGSVNYSGDRYSATIVRLDGSAHDLADLDTTFGDGFGLGTTSVVQSVEILGGNLLVEAGRLVNIAARLPGGTVTLDGARTNGAGSSIDIRTSGLLTIGSGDSIGDMANPFANVVLESGDIALGSGIFADIATLFSGSGVLNFGGPAAFNYTVDSTEIAALNTGAIGTLFLNGFGTFNHPALNGRTTNLFAADLTSVNLLEVLGTTTVDGAFNALNMNLYGPTTLLANSSLSATSGSAMRFFDSLTVNDNGALNAIDGVISFVNADPANVGNEAAADIFGSAGNSSLMINAGSTGLVTLANVGTNGLLDGFTTLAGQIDFRGNAYNAINQSYSADLMNILADGPNAMGSTVSFAGAAPGFNVQTLVFNDSAGASNGTINVADGLTLRMIADVSTAVLGDIVGSGSGDQILIAEGGDLQFSNITSFGSVGLTSDQIAVGNVGTTGNQTYSMLDNGMAGQLRLLGNSYASSGAGTISFNGFAGDAVDLQPAMGFVAVTTANGGTVNLNAMSIMANGTGLLVNTGNAGTINFASGIQIIDGTQTYLGGSLNFLGDATLTSTQPNATITFLGGSANLLGTNGLLTLETSGANAGINFGNAQIVLNGNDILASASGPNTGVILSNLLGTGTETVTVRSNGQAILAAAGGGGLSVLDIQANGLAINGLTLADAVILNTFGIDGSRDISVGDDASLAAGTLNISNASLANLAPVAGGMNTLTIGDASYAGQILIGDATVNRNVSFLSGNGLVRVAETGLMGTGGLGSIAMTAAEIQLGGAIQSGAGLFSLALNGPVNVSGNADIDTNGGAVVFADAINGLASGVGILDVNTAGGQITMREDLGVIGGARSLESLSLIGSPTLRLVGANTAGNQFFSSGEGSIVLLDGAAFAAGDGAGVTFASATIAQGDATVAVGNDGSISFQDTLDGVGASAQTVALSTGADGVVNLGQVGGVAGLGSLAIDSGSVNLNGDLTLLQNLGINAVQTTLFGDRVFSAQSISLITDLDASEDASLTLENAIDTLIQGRLGGNSALANFTSSDSGTTTLTGGIFTDGLALFRNNVTIAGDAIVQSFGANAQSGIRFLGTIDGQAAGADSLTLIVDRSLGALLTDPITGDRLPDANAPVIALFGDVGSNIALGTLGLNFGTDVNGNAVDGRDFVSANATIVLGDSDAFVADGSTTDITLNVANLLMGQREKMAVLGSLNAVGTNARLSDISTVGDLIVNYDAVTVLLREAGDVFDPTTGLVIQDTGTDFVSGGQMQFGTIVALEGAGANPQFSLPGGDPNVDTTAGAFLFKSLGTSVSDLINSGSTIIDVRADGPTNTNISEALAGAVPQEQPPEPVVTDVPLSQVALDALVDLGIVIKQPGANLYLIDLPDDIAGPSDTARVSRRRLEPTLVSTLVADYDAALKEVAPAGTVEGGAAAATDEPTVSVIRRDAAIKATLDSAWEAFTDARGEDGTAADFYAFVQSDSGDFDDALVEIDRLRDVVYAARVLGLTEREIGAVKTKMFTMMQPNMGPRVFRDLIEARPSVLLGVR